MIERTWELRELPILEALVDADYRGERVENTARIAAMTGLDIDAVRQAVRLLIHKGLLEGRDVTDLNGVVEWLNIRTTPVAHEKVGAWPGDPYDEAIRVLEQRIAAEPDAERRSRLERLRDDLIEIGKGTASALLASILRGMAG